jgi:hypothetical protein
MGRLVLLGNQLAEMGLQCEIPHNLGTRGGVGHYVAQSSAAAKTRCVRSRSSTSDPSIL